MKPRFDPDVLRHLRRVDRALTHHEHTLRELARENEGRELNRMLIGLLERRLLRLRADTAATEADRRGLSSALARLGIDLEKSDAKVGRDLRTVLGQQKASRKIPK